MWAGVRERFRRLHSELHLTTAQIEDGMTKQLGVRTALEAAYYSPRQDPPRGFVVGSWGKQTAIRPPVDVDIFFEMPIVDFQRIDGLAGNKQSALLQELKRHLQSTYPQTDMRGDGQVVVVGFNSIVIEVVPAFRVAGNQFVIPDTNDGGRWKMADPIAEGSFLDGADRAANNNARPLAMMIKAWKRECNIPLKSYQLELLVADFIATYPYRHYDYFYYDWYVRDFLVRLCGLGGMSFTAPGTGEVFALGYDWLTRAISARDRAILACDYEKLDQIKLAGEEWQKIFGARVPLLA